LQAPRPLGEAMMRQATTGRRSSAMIARYLLPREHVIVDVRLHRAVLIVPAAQAAGGLLFGTVAAFAIPETTVRLVVIWAAVALLLGHLVRMVARSEVEYLVLTDQRLLLTTGFGYRRVTQIPLTQLVNVSLGRSFAGRILGYGAFVNEAGGRSELISDFVRYPEQVYILLCGMLFPSTEDDPDE
jgi:Bacterial PH domain